MSNSEVWRHRGTAFPYKSTSGPSCNHSYYIRVDRHFLNADDRVLIIDDFLAVGQALSGMLDLCAQAGASVAGIGIAIEKAFQGGGDRFRALGYDVYALARIDHFTDDGVVFAEV